MARYKGLYQIPSLMQDKASSAPRPLFNSMRYAVPDRDKAAQVIEEAALVVNGLPTDQNNKGKKKRKLSNGHNNSAISATRALDMDEKATETKRKKKKRSSHAKATDGDITMEPSGIDAAATINSAQDRKMKKDKKRKRLSDTAPLSAPAGKTTSSVELGGAWLQHLKSSTKHVDDNPDLSNSSQLLDETPTKTEKTKRKRVSFRNEANQASESSTQATNRDVQVETAAAHQDQKQGARESGPSPEDNPQRNLLAPSPVGSYANRRPINTPIPLPLGPSPEPRNTASSPQDSTSLVGCVKLKKALSISDAITCPTVLDDNRLTSSAPTDLQRYTQALDHAAKPRARGARASSVSIASSMNIKEAFARIPKTAATKEASLYRTPMGQEQGVGTGVRNEGMKPTGDLNVEALFGSVNMIQEHMYLTQHMVSRAANDAAGPLPCLKSATGCNAKAEEHIAMLMKEKESDPSMMMMTSSDDEHQLAFEVSVAAAFEAEKFLHSAVVIGIPVPAGHVCGRYTLYCPKYAETHADKYGFGQREFLVSRVPTPPGVEADDTYTARLGLPPRPMAYTVRAFSIPPNASFRPIQLSTVGEGYTMSLVVLGNGYILLRIDVGLFLTGKSAMGTRCMEFIGVRPDAMAWGGRDKDIQVARSRASQRAQLVAEQAKRQAQEAAAKQAQEKAEKAIAWEKRKEEMRRERERLKRAAATDSDPGGALYSSTTSGATCMLHPRVAAADPRLKSMKSTTTTPRKLKSETMAEMPQVTTTPSKKKIKGRPKTNAAE
ncbi:hypothetical protein ACEQ8H_004865 [Pleosporales sp. CAS-2024a]